MPKKKERKPKAKIHNKENITQIQNNDCLIAHIPLSLDKIQTYNNKNDIIINDIKKKVVTNSIINTELFTNKKPLLNNKSEQNLQLKIKVLENKITELEELNISKIYYNNSSVNLYNNIKHDSNNLCWHCCHKFDNIPIYLPETKKENKYHVYGYFCSFNCALAYNIELNDYKVWERSSLLNQLQFDITKNCKNIFPAPNKYLLKSFGGGMDINEFRNNSINIDKSYRFIIPPLTSIIPIIEVKNNNKPKNVSININKELVLRRTKPLNKNTNSIEKIMNLQLH
jgi:hypothetical protein